MYLGLKGLRTVFLSLGKESPYTFSKFNLLNTETSIWTLSMAPWESPYIFFTFNLLNTDTPLIWTLSMAPSVSILTSFDSKCEEGHHSKRHNLCS